MFLTGLAPNLLAVELVRKAAGVEFTWAQWFVAFAPAGILLLVLVPPLVAWLYPPEVRDSPAVAEWAAQELARMGGISAGEIKLAVLVAIALALWIFGGDYINATTVALAAISLMLVTGVLAWDDITAHKAAWNTLAWFATLVTLADGLARTGFVKWFAGGVAGQITGFSPTAAMVVLVLVFFFGHYLFASITAHVTAMLPVMLAVGAGIPGINMAQFALLLCLTLGIMGIITPYATGPSPVYYGSGYLPSADYWRLGAIFGVIFIAVLLAVGVPWVMMVN
jgi:L-tartrate/succinate antiporter